MTDRVTCDRCRNVTAPRDRAALKAAGWLEMARAGKRPERCPP